MKKEKTTSKTSTAKKGRPSKKKTSASSLAVEVDAAVEPQKTSNTYNKNVARRSIAFAKNAIRSLFKKLKRRL